MALTKEKRLFPTSLKTVTALSHWDYPMVQGKGIEKLMTAVPRSIVELQLPCRRILKGDWEAFMVRSMMKD